MEELQKEYTMLFNGITDTIASLEKLVTRLKVLQQRAEEACLGRDEETPEEMAYMLKEQVVLLEEIISKE